MLFYWLYLLRQVYFLSNILDDVRVRINHIVNVRNKDENEEGGFMTDFGKIRPPPNMF